jgi:hypothetical protein
LKPAKARKTSRGQIQIVEDGKVVAVQKENKKFKTLPGGYTKFNEIKAQKICDYVTTGRTLKEIGSLKTMPSTNTIYYWKRNYEDFRKALEHAEEARAEYFADKVIETAEKINTELQSKTHKVKIEAYKWRAGVDHATRYGKKTTVSGDPDKPLTILISTGINREQGEIPNGKKETIEVQSESKDSRKRKK